jgi:predicted TPR repeat methyltransferase
MANAHSPPEGDPLEHAENLIAKGEAGAAAVFLRAHLGAGRGGLLARLTLVRALLAMGDIEQALEEAREASALNPGISLAALALGEALMQAGYLPVAIGEFQRALRLDPQSNDARFLLGCAWLEAGEAERALELFETLPHRAGLAEKIAAASAIRTAPRSDAGYVRHLFDQFSADYDARMRGQLAYAAPEILRSLADLIIPGRTNLSILDLGCGTGLAGEVFKPLARRLDGIDLSPAMLAKARARGIYDELMVGDLETALASTAARYDLILAADTLVYLGDLANTFAGAFQRLAPDGYFLFTVERNDGEGFALGPKRRWRHSEAYLRTEAAKAGLDVAGLVAASPRREANQPVEGFAVALSRPA